MQRRHRRGYRRENIKTAKDLKSQAGGSESLKGCIEKETLLLV